MNEAVEKQTADTGNELTPAVQQFVLHWGEMGTRWGVIRTVAQIHALLFLSVNPVCADEIVATLKVARSNVSNSLNELLKMGMIHRTHKLGDRRDHYVAVSDIWELFSIVTAERKKREIDPTLTKLRELELQGPAGDDYAEARIAELRELIELMTGFYDDMEKLETERLVKLLTLGSKVAGLIDKAGAMVPSLKPS